MNEARLAFTPEIVDVFNAESISLFDAEPGSHLVLDVCFDEDGQQKGKFVLNIDRSARREDWDRGAFTVVGAEVPFESSIGELIGKTGFIDASVTYRPGLMPPITLATVARATKGRDLIMNFDIPDQPDKVNRWIPFVVDCSLIPPTEE